MEIAHDLWPRAITRGAMRSNQRGGINLEMRCRIARNIGGGQSALDTQSRAEHQPASLTRSRRPRRCDHRRKGALADL